MEKMEDKITTVLLRLLAVSAFVTSGVLFGNGNVAGFALLLVGVVMEWASRNYEQLIK